MKKFYLTTHLTDPQLFNAGFQVLSAKSLKVSVSPSLPDYENNLTIAGSRPLTRAIRDFMRASAEHQASLGASILIEDPGLDNLDRQREWFQLLEPYGYSGGFITDSPDSAVHPTLTRCTVEEALEEGLLPIEVIPAGWEVMVVGDVQSAGARLEKLVEEHDHEKMLWVFAGDLFDRGENPEIVYRIVNRLGKRSRLVLGNHDWNILKVLREPDSSTKQQTRISIQLLRERIRLRPGTLKRWVAGFVPAFDFQTSEGNRYFVTHGGVSLDSLPLRDGRVNLHSYPDVGFMLGTRSNSSITAGIGCYPKKVDRTLAALSANSLDGMWAAQFHGHRHSEAPGSVPGVYGLESEAERPDGKLTAALISQGLITVVEAS